MLPCSVLASLARLPHLGLAAISTLPLLLAGGPGAAAATAPTAAPARGTAPSRRFGGTVSLVPPVERRSVNLHGHRFAYREASPGGDDADLPVLLLVHGMAGSSTTWRAAMPALARHYRVIAPDLLGHGHSDKPRHDYSLGAHATCLRDLLVAVGADRATVVGHSLGGGVAMQLAFQYPELCERMVLVSSGGLGPEVSWMLRALALPGVELLMPLIFPGVIRDAGNAVSRGLGRIGFRAPHLEEQWRGYVSLTDPANRQSFLRTLRAVVDSGGQCVSAHDRLYLAARVPTLVVWGEKDRTIPVSHAAAAHRAVPGSRLEVFDGCGHFPHVERPERFVEAVRDFVDTTDPMRLTAGEWAEVLRSGMAAAQVAVAEVEVEVKAAASA
ncbi:MAG TPA: alpha/beta fold hydrolase [Acidimicrobiales bacterium]|nr:alpha/beta fold hydrolase [Acidimicrobiales bacterium]